MLVVLTHVAEKLHVLSGMNRGCRIALDIISIFSAPLLASLSWQPVPFGCSLKGGTTKLSVPLRDAGHNIDAA